MMKIRVEIVLVPDPAWYDFLDSLLSWYEKPRESAQTEVRSGKMTSDTGIKGGKKRKRGRPNKVPIETPPIDAPIETPINAPIETPPMDAPIEAVEILWKSCGNPDPIETPMADPPGSKKSRPEFQIDPLIQIDPPQLENYTQDTNRKVPGYTHLEYSETEDGRLYIRYLSGRLYTIWNEIQRVAEILKKGPKKKIMGLLLPHGCQECQTALTQFCRAYSEKIVKPGDTLQTRQNEGDPDADFRSLGVASAVYPPVRTQGIDGGEGVEE